MSVSIDTLYWNALMSGFSYQDGMSSTPALVNTVTSRFYSNPVGEFHDSTGFDVLLLQKTTTPDVSTATLPEVTIAFRGTEFLEDYASDAVGDGVETTAVNRYGAHFDLDANGFAEAAGWVSADDGILVRDLNADGIEVPAAACQSKASAPKAIALVVGRETGLQSHSCFT